MGLVWPDHHPRSHQWCDRPPSFFRRGSWILFFCLSSCLAHAQLFGITGANHPELDWNEIQTDHFTIVYHQGLDSTARIAAPIAEEVYRVVTTNLETAIPYKIRIYLSDNDEVRNAFTFGDHYIFIWMRGILDDNLFSLRASGTSKWLRSVITHEFTHFVIARATHTFADDIFPALAEGVPRWFNEGMARYMEPDGWTDDLDVALRAATVSSKLHLGLEDFLGGVLMYEGGQSLVRYIAVTYGDSALVRIVKHRESSIAYNFDEAVKAATGHTMDEIYKEWHKILNVYYNTEFGQKEDIEDIARKIPTGLEIIGAARIAPDGDRIAVMGKRKFDEPGKLFILKKIAGRKEYRTELLTGEPGIEPYLSWSTDGKYILFSKIRFGQHGDMVYDLYRCNAETGDLERISTNERLEYPDYAPDGKTIVATQVLRSGSDLVLMNADGTNLHKLTNFNDDNVEVYSPRFSPDGTEVAFSIFRKNGMRDVATVNVATGVIHYLTNDSINDRYPVWSPKGDSLLFLSFQNGIPNLYAAPSAGIASRSQLRQLTDVASNVLAWDWSAKKDSILVSSFTGRNSVQLFWIPANRSVSNASAVPLAKKYTDWRSIRWPLITRPADSLPPAIVTGPYDYNSLSHIRPLLFFPIVGTDVDQNGNRGAQWGLTSILTDELQKHLIEPFLWYGDAAKRFSYGIFYQNNQLVPSITVDAENVIEFRDVIQDIADYQQTVGADLGFDLIKHTPNSTEDFHNVFVGASYQKMTPWNPPWSDSLFTSFPQAIEVAARFPIAAKLLEFTGLYSYLSPLLQFGAGVAYFNKNVASDLSRTRIRAFFDKEIPWNENELNQIAFLLQGAADFGDELPQDFLGFYKYDAFEEGFNLTAIHERDRLRGIRRYYYGNRMLLASIELREADPVFQNLLPLLQPFAPQLVGFFDLGSTWYANAPSNNFFVTAIPLSKTEWLKSAGVELRSGIAYGPALEGGVGWELVKNSSADWFIRVTEPF